MSIVTVCGALFFYVALTSLLQKWQKILFLVSCVVRTLFLFLTGAEIMLLYPGPTPKSHQLVSLMSPWCHLYKPYTYWRIFFKFCTNVHLNKTKCRAHVALVSVKVTLEGQGHWWEYESHSAIMIDFHIMALIDLYIYLPNFIHKFILPKTFISLIRDIHGWVVRVIDLELLAPHWFGFESHQGLLILSCDKSIQLAYGTSVVLLRCPLVPGIMQGEAPEVFLHQ